jgi:Asp-tRNA(Asn)/Glu-tRNA(Gln) amidotransferase A subunit family amidase
VQEIRLPQRYDEAQIDQRIIQLAENARCYEIERRQYRNQLSPSLAAMLDEGAVISEAQYQASIARTAITREQTDAMFSDVDAWLMPSAQGAAPKGLESTGDPVFNRLVTAMHLPAINIPVFRNHARMPLGLQLICARHQDEKLFAIATQVNDILLSTNRD